MIGIDTQSLVYDQGIHAGLNGVLKAIESITQALELDLLCDVILDQVRDLTGCTAAGLLLSEQNCLKIAGYRGPLSDAEVQRIQPDAQDGFTFLMRPQAALVSYAEAADRAWLDLMPGLRRLMGSPGSWVCAPLFYRERPVGVLWVSHETPGYFDMERAGSLAAVAGPAANAIEHARLYARAHQVAAQQERQRLAHAMHDSASQALYGIGISVRAARAMLINDPARAAEALEIAASTADRALAEMRAVLFDLRTEALLAEGLIAGLLRQAEVLRVVHDIDVELVLAQEPDVAPEIKEGLYRIAREACANIARHAHARTVQIRLSSMMDDVAMTFSDDGVGFDPNQIAPGHLGVKLMRKRAESLGGILTILSSPGRRTSVHVVIPAVQPRRGCSG